MTKGKNDNHLIIYQDDNGLVKINVRFAGKDVWVTSRAVSRDLRYYATEYSPTH